MDGGSGGNRTVLIAPALRKPASGYALRRFPQRTCFLYTSLQPVNDNRLRALVIIQRARLVKIQRAATVNKQILTVEAG